MVALTGLVLPQLLARLPEMLGPKAPPPPLPLWMLMMLSMAQSGVLLALAVWAGAALAPAVGLHAPTFEAIVTRSSIAHALKPQLVPGLIGGTFGGILIAVFSLLAPPDDQRDIQLMIPKNVEMITFHHTFTRNMLVKMPSLISLGECSRERFGPPQRGG